MPDEAAKTAFLAVARYLLSLATLLRKEIKKKKIVRAVDGLILVVRRMEMGGEWKVKMVARTYGSTCRLAMWCGRVEP